MAPGSSTHKPQSNAYLLDLADVTPSFHDGWQSGNVALMLTDDTSVLHQLEVYRALKGHARLAFTHAY